MTFSRSTSRARVARADRPGRTADAGGARSAFRTPSIPGFKHPLFAPASHGHPGAHCKTGSGTSGGFGGARSGLFAGFETTSRRFLLPSPLGRYLLLRTNNSITAVAVAVAARRRRSQSGRSTRAASSVARAIWCSPPASTSTASFTSAASTTAAANAVAKSPHGAPSAQAEEFSE